MLITIVIFSIASFIVGYFVGSNNPTKSVIKKIKDKL